MISHDKLSGYFPKLLGAAGVEHDAGSSLETSSLPCIGRLYPVRPDRDCAGCINGLRNTFEMNPMQSTHNTLSENIRAQSIELLNKLLAAAIDWHAQVKQAHWNVRGHGFIAIHEFFDKVSADVEAFSDQIAGRAGGLGGTAQGTIQVAAERSSLVPYKHGIADEKSHVFAVAGSLAAFGQSAREAIIEAGKFGDVAAADILKEISRGIDKQLWFAGSHIPPK